MGTYFPHLFLIFRHPTEKAESYFWNKDVLFFDKYDSFDDLIQSNKKFILQNKDNLKNYMFIINKVIGLTKEYIDKYKLSPIWISCKGDPEGNKKYNIYKKIIQKNENYFKDYEIDYNDYSQLIRFYKNN